MSQSAASAQPRDETIPAADGLPLKAWLWTRPEPRATLVLAHGLGEHAGCYQHVAEALGPACRIDVLAFDFRGHGRSPGKRGQVRSFDEYSSDLRGVLDWAAEHLPGRPRFLLGHSNGALVALRTELSFATGLDGLIVTNPALCLAQPVPHVKRWLGAFLRRWAPGVTLSTAVATEEMTRDPTMRAGRDQDPLRHTRICAPIFYGITEGGQEVCEHAELIRVPILVVLGQADPLIDARTTERFVERLGSPDKSLRVFPEMLHEPLNELGRAEVFAEISEWIERHLPREREAARHSSEDPAPGRSFL